MVHRKSSYFTIPMLLSLLLITLFNVVVSYAVENRNRTTEISIPFTQYEWWMLSWSDNQLQCQVFTDHEGIPTDDEIFVYCGENLYNQWKSTDACPAIIDVSSNTQDCKGFYLHLVSTEELTKTIQVELPKPEAWINIKGCDLTANNNYCSNLPTLVITGVEPLPNEKITRIQGTYNEIPFMCEGSTCEISMRPTPTSGVVVNFWAESSFGDETEHYSSLIRVVETGITDNPEEEGWYIEMMSPRWNEKQTESCAQTWRSFPPIEGPPPWLITPETSELLASDEPYMFLAGRLIAQGLVDALDCPNHGLENNGYANICGLEKARDKVDEWQNQFDNQIITVAKNTGVPAQLIKNLFAKESQFWPGAFNGGKEFGLGQITELGADTVLLWNNSFFFQFCPLVLDTEKCEAGYAQLDEEEQAILRGAVVSNASAYCPECPSGINLSHAEFSIKIFAQTLQANCEQTGRILTNITGKNPGEVSSYEDLWRFTLVNYHGGPGCLLKAMKSIPQGAPINWENISVPLEEECPGVIDYVNDICK